ncbi:MAG: phosphoribosylanthranilate isomerase [Huintestinicola sp.]
MIKLCGMRRAEDISYVNEFLPDYIGFILAEGFRRTVDADTAGELVKKLDGRIKKVGVFVDTPFEKVKYAAGKIGLDVLQLHGNEDAEYINKIKSLGLPIWKAVRVRTSEDILNAQKLDCECLLLDSFTKETVGGSGKVADWSIISKTKISKPFFLAGGLNTENICEALEICENIDLSGGIEAEGVKDREKIKRVMEIYREKTERKF